MAGRKPKLTDEKSDRKSQRDRTSELVNENNDLPLLPTRPPSYLGRISAHMWRDLVKELNKKKLVRSVDSTTVELFCVNYEIMRKAYDNLKEHGEMTEMKRTLLNPKTGDIVAVDSLGFKKNPATQVVNDATAKLKSLSQDLGLSPASRAMLLNVTKNDGDDGGDNLAQFGV